MTLRLRTLPTHLRAPIAAFVLVGLVGYAAGLAFIAHNTGMHSEGIAAHYHGDEEEMKFGKSIGEMLEIVHTHLLGMGVFFFAVAVIYAFTDAKARWKTLWATETLLSLLSTFGSLWLVASGQRWATWVLYPSSVLMVVGFFFMSCVILWHCLTPDGDDSPPHVLRDSPH
jgi:hypothetical protein